jgi:hypothetical protein
MLVEVASWILDSEKQGVRTGVLDISWSDCEGLIIPVMLDKVWGCRRNRWHRLWDCRQKYTIQEDIKPEVIIWMIVRSCFVAHCVSDEHCYVFEVCKVQAQIIKREVLLH